MVFLWRSDAVGDLVFAIVGGAHPERDDHNMTDEGFLMQLHARPTRKFQCPSVCAHVRDSGAGGLVGWQTQTRTYLLNYDRLKMKKVNGDPSRR